MQSLYTATLAVKNESFTIPFPTPRWDVAQPMMEPNDPNNTFAALGNITEAENFCRNPGGMRAQPWCYYQNENGSFTIQDCHIDECQPEGEIIKKK